MNDRDRLAADLHPWTCRNWETDHEPGQPAKHSLDFVACIPAADRLIALGWARLTPLDGRTDDDFVQRADPIKYRRAATDGYSANGGNLAALDEERLARALLVTQGYTMETHRQVYGDDVDILDAPHEWFDSTRVLAAAIAKAYREDSE